MALWKCYNIVTLIRYLSTLSFPGESYKAVDRTLDQAETLLQKLEVLLDKLLTTERRSFTLEQFLAEIIQDESLLPDLWVRLGLGSFKVKYDPFRSPYIQFICWRFHLRSIKVVEGHIIHIYIS